MCGSKRSAKIAILIVHLVYLLLYMNFATLANLQRTMQMNSTNTWLG